MSHSPDNTKYTPLPSTPHPPFSEKGDKSVSLKYIHMLFKFKGKERNILRHILTFQNASFSIYLDLARSTGSTTADALLQSNCKIPRLLQVLASKPTGL